MATAADDSMDQSVELGRRLVHQQPTKEEWEGQRSAIKALYQDEGKTLWNVIDIMRSEHAFRPTYALRSHCIVLMIALIVPRLEMYKRKIREWGLNNKNRKRKAAELTAHEPEADVQDMDKQRKVRDAFLGAAVAGHRQGNHAERLLVARRTRTPSPSTLQSPEVFHAQETILHGIKSYVRGSFEGSDMLLAEDRRLREREARARFGALADNLHITALFIDRGSYTDAESALNSNIPRVETFLTQMHPEMLGRLFGLLLRFLRHGRLIFVVLGQILFVARQILALAHPMRSIFEYLSSISGEQFRHCVDTTWQFLNDTLDAAPGYMIDQMDITQLRASHIRHIGRMQNFQWAEAALRHIVDQSQVAYGCHSWNWLACSLRLTDLLYQVGKSDEAMELAQTIIRRATPKAGHNYQEIVANCHVLLSSVAIKRQNFGAAELHLWKAIEVEAVLYGWRASRITPRLINLEETLRLRGEIGWADKIRGHREGLWNSAD